MGFYAVCPTEVHLSALPWLISLGLVNITWRVNQAISLKQLPLCPDCKTMDWLAYEDTKAKTISLITLSQPGAVGES